MPPKDGPGQTPFKITPEGVLKPKNKPENARNLYAIERDKYEFNMQKNPVTGKIPFEEKRRNNF